MNTLRGRLDVLVTANPNSLDLRFLQEYPIREPRMATTVCFRSMSARR